VTPAVAVVMSVHNGAPHVARAIASVLRQTLGELEMIVVDDGSTDETPTLLTRVDDPRLRIVTQQRTGLTRALNRALAAATAPLVARLDADDEAVADRLERQRAVLDRTPDVGLLGTAARELDAGGRLVRVVQPPLDDAALRRVLIRRNPFVHSSVMMRRALVERVGGYDETFPVAQDYDLWMRLSCVTRMANLPDALVIRTLGERRVSVEREDDRLRAEMRVRWRAVRKGVYPPWCAVFAVRPALALALPRPLRRAARAALGGARP
jgi:glycosyltransferase involved in cell wall biosynthesis